VAQITVRWFSLTRAVIPSPTPALSPTNAFESNADFHHSKMF